MRWQASPGQVEELSIQSRHRIIFETALVVGLAASTLLLHASQFELDRLHIRPLNDQVGYISTARWFADTGELRSHLIYPSFVETENWRLYMPGHYWVLAGAYRLFGSHPLVWRLPSLASFLISAACVFLAARRLYGARAGFASAVLFIAFPANLFFAFTAMSEPTVVAACTLSFCVFVRARKPLRWMPGLLVVPFLFRELTVLLLVPMLFVAIWRPSNRRVSSLLTSLIATLAVLAVAYAWQAAAGKVPIPLSWIVGGFNFNDAVLQASFPPLSMGELIQGVLDRFATNAEMLSSRLLSSRGISWERQCVLGELALILTSLVVGIRSARRDLYPLGAALFGLGTFLAVMALHKASPNSLCRHLSISVPFAAIAVAPAALRAAETFIARIPQQRRMAAGWFLAAATALPLFAASHAIVSEMAGKMILTAAPKATERLEGIGHDDRLLLVAGIGYLDYVRKHYPVRWSFVPANGETLRLLDERYSIGTLLLRRAQVTAISRRVLHELGFRSTQELGVSSVWRKVESQGATPRPLPEDHPFTLRSQEPAALRAHPVRVREAPSNVGGRTT